jgi:predicted RNA-binding Zn-ribbon protein involved in translation (DUF1610 family)
MDIATTITAVTSALKLAKDGLQLIFNATVSAQAKDQVRAVRDSLGVVQDKLFELREELANLQQERDDLRRKLTTFEDWDAKASGYQLTQTEGGAVVYVSSAAPKHFACPNCFDHKSLQILQDTRMASGHFECPGCGKSFPVKARVRTSNSVPIFRA